MTSKIRPSLMCAAMAAAALLGGASGAAAAASLPDPRDMRAAQTLGARTPLPALVQDVEHLHPVAMFLLARRLFDEGRKDEATFWFYEGQLRWRAYMMDGHRNEADDFTRLFETIGPDLNFYAACDVPAMLAMYDKVLDWDASHPDDLKTSSTAKTQSRAGLKSLGDDTRAHPEELIKAHKGRAECAVAKASAGGDPYAGDGGAIFGTPQEMVSAYDARRFKALRIGVTTKAEAVAALGKPEWWASDKDGSTLGYSYSMRTPAASLLGMTRRVTVSLAFDPQRRLQKLDLPDEKAP